MPEETGKKCECEALRRIMDERDRLYMDKFAAEEKARQIALAAQDKRLEGMNEFRSAIQDQGATFLPRIEFDARYQALLERIEHLSSRQDKTEGRFAGANYLWAVIASVLGLALVAVAAIAAFMPAKR